MSAANRSLGDLRALQRTIGAVPARDSPWGLLPVFYLNLDPARIPSIPEMDRATWSQDESCNHAYLSLSSLAHLVQTPEHTISDALATELWPRVWNWIKFFHECRVYLPFLCGRSAEENIYSIYSALLNSFNVYASDLIDGTPGIFIVRTAAWKILLRIRPAQESVYIQIRHLVAHLAYHPPQNLVEVVEGAGGTLADLAALLVMHFRSATLTPDFSESSATLHLMLNMAVIFITKISDTDGPVSSALISGGIIAAEVAALKSWANVTPYESEFSEDNHIEGVCFPQLLNFMEVPPGYPQIQQALQAGLLRVIIHRGRRRADDTLHAYVKELLTRILPASTIYHSVLSQFRQSLLDVRDIEDSPSFRESQVFTEWTTFKHIVQERLDIKEYYDSENHFSREACHNEECGTIQRRTEFRRCSFCQSAYYCSLECQLADWRVGGHRDSCGTLRSWHLDHDPSRHLSKRDQSFFRVLVHTHYMKARDRLLFDQTIRMRSYSPGRLSVLFDYSTSEDRIGALAWPIEITNPSLNYWVSRAEKSMGKMEIHLVSFRSGTKRCSFHIPMRISDSQVRDELRRISHEIPEGTDATRLGELFPDIDHRIRTLLDTPVEEMH